MVSILQLKRFMTGSEHGCLKGQRWVIIVQRCQERMLSSKWTIVGGFGLAVSGMILNEMCWNQSMLCQHCAKFWSCALMVTFDTVLIGIECYWKGLMGLVFLFTCKNKMFNFTFTVLTLWEALVLLLLFYGRLSCFQFLFYCSVHWLDSISALLSTVADVNKWFWCF